MKHTTTRILVLAILFTVIVQNTLATQNANHFLHATALDDSAYARKTIGFKAEVAVLQRTNNITENSKKVMDAFLIDIGSPFPQQSKDKDEYAFMRKYSGIKTIETYFDEKESKIFLKKVSFNEHGQPTLVTIYSRDGGENSIIRLMYKNGIVTGIKYREDLVYVVQYDNDKMVMYCNTPDFTDTQVMWIENDVLLTKSYFLMNDDAECIKNSFAEDKIENSCLVCYYNEKISTRNCSSKIDIFPYVNQYTSYQDGEVLQHIKSKIVKINEHTFEKYYSDVEEGENYKLWGTFNLNEQNLMTKYTFTKNGVKKVLMIDYTYYP